MGREEDDEHSPDRTLWPSVRNRDKIRKADWQRGFNFSPVLSLSLVKAGQLIDRPAFHLGPIIRKCIEPDIYS